MHHRFFSCASACSPSYICVYDITFVFTVCFFDLFFLLELLQIRAWSSFIVGRSWLVPSSSMMAFALRTSSSSAFWLRVTGGGLIWAPFPLRFIQFYLKLLCFSTCAYGMFANSSFAPSAARALFTVFFSCGSLPLSSLNVCPVRDGLIQGYGNFNDSRKIWVDETNSTEKQKDWLERWSFSILSKYTR